MIDSWARGIVPQASLDCLETEVEVVEPVAIQTVVEAPPTRREERSVMVVTFVQGFVPPPNPDVV